MFRWPGQAGTAAPADGTQITSGCFPAKAPIHSLSLGVFLNGDSHNSAAQG